MLICLRWCHRETLRQDIATARISTFVKRQQRFPNAAHLQIRRPLLALHFLPPTIMIVRGANERTGLLRCIRGALTERAAIAANKRHRKGKVSAMQSVLVMFRRRPETSRSLRRIACVSTLTTGALTFPGSSAHAIPAATSSSQPDANRGDLVEKMVVVRRSRAAVGPRGGAAYRSRTVVRPGWNGAGTRWARPVRPVRPWVRPARYWWPVGGAIVAGAAVGYVTAAPAAAWAGAPPAPGYCWYYTDPSRTNGFWDVCP